ncbi:hypothetical protein ACFX5U_20470 [Sphingobacterium sp. SG20118]|uniref:hypothetical protein n=1 Tax=Sphingobacterium sp. SG20118 TaxID=3367156 RepID=UPI0037DFC239
METYIDKVTNKVTEYQAKLTKALTDIGLDSEAAMEEENSSTDGAESTNSSSTNREEKQLEDNSHAPDNQKLVDQLDQSDDFFTLMLYNETISNENTIFDSTTETGTAEVISNPIPQSTQNSADILGAFSSFSDSSIREIIKLLSYSLLSGEFLSIKFLSIKAVDEKLSTLIKQIQELVTIVQLSPELSKEWLSFSDAIVYCLEEYQKFVNYLVANFTKNRSDDYFIIEDESIDAIPHLSDDLQNVIRIFTLTLKVSRKDLLINSDRSELQSLTLLKKQVDKLSSIQKTVAHALDIKLKFLIHKWGQRYKCENQNSSVRYRIDNTEESLDHFNIKIPTLKDWNDKIHHHYDFCKDKKQYTHYIHDILDEKRKGYDKINLSLLKLHGLIKYYKDFSKSEPELKKIVDYLLQKDYSEEHDYDQYCIEIFRNYAINNYFSLVSENKTLELDEYQKIYQDCKSKLNHLSENYFLEKKYLDYVLEKIDAEFAQSSKEDKISLHEKYVNKVDQECSQILKEYYEKKEWAKTHDNYIVILPYEESLVDISSEKYPDLPKILFFTSFVLPYYKDSIDYHYSETRQRFREVKSLTSVVGSLKSDLQKLENLNKDFDRKDLKSIETITLFTAVITFILSSIPAFKFVETVQQAALFMLSMSASLGIFILLIFSFTRGLSKFLTKPRSWLGALIIILIFTVIFFVLKVTSGSLIDFEKTTKKDTINSSIQNQNELDSIKRNSEIPPSKNHKNLTPERNKTQLK